MQEWTRACVAELVGTFALCFIGAGSICVNSYSGNQVGLLGVAVAHGLILSIAVSATMNLSGGHLNPAVTFGFYVTGRMDRKLALQYVGAQLIGATLAGLFLRAIF
jgi:glycerol uptake facilitator-like aquaporin